MQFAEHNTTLAQMSPLHLHKPLQFPLLFSSHFASSASSTTYSLLNFKYYKARRNKMVDLPIEILRLIMMFVARSPDGAATFASAISSCKRLREFGSDKEILKTVKFQNAKKFVIKKSFWQEKGLLVKCARAENEGASSFIWKKYKAEAYKSMGVMFNDQIFMVIPQ